MWDSLDLNSSVVRKGGQSRLYAILYNRIWKKRELAYGAYNSISLLVGFILFEHFRFAFCNGENTGAILNVLGGLNEMMSEYCQTDSLAVIDTQ